MTVSDEAVEAAARVMYAQDSKWEDLGEFSLDVFAHDAREVLESAAPYMLATATTAEELDALPVASVIRTEVGSIYVKEDIRGASRRSWWVTTNEQFDFETKDIELPAQVLYVAEHNRAWPS